MVLLAKVVSTPGGISSGGLILEEERANRVKLKLQQSYMRTFGGWLVSASETNSNGRDSEQLRN